MNRIYLDNAATSWPKPEAVYRAVDDYQRRLGAPAGRGSYAEAAEAERIVVSCRKKIATLIGASDAARIIFTLNGTDSLNTALHGLLKPGDHVITSVCEHNSVLRPLRYLTQSRDVTVTYVPCDGQGFVDSDEIRRAITSKTKLIALIHASNVTGALQPATEVGQIAADRDILFLLDAAQSLGYEPIDVRSIGCHFLAAPGHKGLLGPLGTGVLYLASGIEDQVIPIRQGGTGTRSDDESLPTTMPDRFEAGNLNVAGIAGLEAGVTHVLTARDDIARIRLLTERLLAGLAETKSIKTYGPIGSGRRVGLVSLNVPGYDPQELSALLDSQWSIQARSGLHCAPRMHAALGTAPAGTLRFSLGHFTTDDDIERALAALREVASF